MSKKQKTAGHPGVGKSKIMKKLRKQWKAWGRDHPMSSEHLAAFAALVRSLPKPSYIFDPSVKTEPVQPRPIQFCTDQWLVEDLDTNATCWDDQMSEMCADFHTLRDRLVDAEDNDRLKLVDELLHRVIEVRCQLNTMKKEQDQ